MYTCDYLRLIEIFLNY